MEQTLHSVIDQMIINKPSRFVLHTQTAEGRQEREFTNALDLLAAAKKFALTLLFGAELYSGFEMMYVQADGKKWTWTPHDYNRLRGLEQTPNFLIWKAA